MPQVADLLHELMDCSAEELARAEAAKQGIEIARVEDITLDDDPFIGEVTGKKITLSDGRTYVPKLIHRQSGGNYGIDTYAYRLESEAVEVVEEYDES